MLVGVLGVIILLTTILMLDWRVYNFSNPYVFNHPDHVPYNQVGLVLGTSKFLSNGQINLYFKYRMDAAAELYKAGKIDYVLVSGDNAHVSYNEPIEMQKALLERGVPKEAIVLDYAGFRTLDSVVRGKEVFGQKKMTIISQDFHNRRAIYIAQYHGIEAIGYNAQDVSYASGFKTQLREKLARVQAFIDLYLLDKQPKFLGAKIKIG